MNNKSFIQGLLYGLGFAQSVLEKGSYFVRGNQVLIWFEDGSRLNFAVNRGIDPIIGAFFATMTQTESCNQFDIAAVWITQAQQEKVESLGFSFENAEIRVSLDDFINIVDALGVIDYGKSQEEWYSIWEKNYK